MDYFIGIDIGTGSTKAVALTVTGKVLHSEKVSYPTITPQPQFSEQAPELIWQAFLKCIQRTVSHLKASPRGISLSSAMHSLIPVDEAGAPLMNMITWADNRSADIAQRVKTSAAGELLYEQTGTPIHPMSPLCKIIWLRENEPALFNKTAKFISIKEYLWFRLFRAFEIDHSIATANGLFHIEKKQWNETALGLCDITPAKLSTPVSTSYTRRDMDRTLATQLQLAPDTPFVIGASDGCLANLGSFAIEPGVAALTIGTSGAIRVANATPIYNFRAMTFNYLLDENTFICGGPINNGGIVLKWYVECFLKRQLSAAADYDEVLADLEHVPAGADGLIFLPYLLGERAPIWNSDACGVFFGITPRHTQAHFTKAVVEGISMALCHIGKALEESGLVINRVHVSGGFVRSHAWLQMMADIFGKPIGLVSTEDASSIGAAYLAMKSLNAIKSYDVLKPEHITTLYPRAENHRVYTGRNFPLYQNLYKNLTVDMAIWHDLTNTTAAAVNFAETAGPMVVKPPSNAS